MTAQDSSSKPRVDILLAQVGLARSRQHAQEIIREGLVSYRGKKIDKPSLLVDALATALDFQIAASPFNRYVSRGGVKLEGALKHTHISVAGLLCLDIGISTGGFTDCLLQQGAARVVGLDVGHQQLAEKLKSDSRVISIEGFNMKDLSPHTLQAQKLPLEYDLVVIDVSFISLAHVLPQCPQILQQNGTVLALVKPQFEVGREHLGKGGIVRDTMALKEVETRIGAVCNKSGLKVQDYFESSIEGADGNKEYFVWASRSDSSE